MREIIIAGAHRTWGPNMVSIEILRCVGQKGMHFLTTHVAKRLYCSTSCKSCHSSLVKWDQKLITQKGRGKVVVKYLPWHDEIISKSSLVFLEQVKRCWKLLNCVAGLWLPAVKLHNLPEVQSKNTEKKSFFSLRKGAALSEITEVLFTAQKI